MIDVHVKDFIDTGDSGSAGLAKRGDERGCRQSTEVEVPDLHDASECRHEARCSEVQGMRGGGRKSSQASEESWTSRQQPSSQSMPYHTGPVAAGDSTESEAESEAGKQKAAKDSERTIPVLSADCCSIGGPRITSAGDGGH